MLHIIYYSTYIIILYIVVRGIFLKKFDRNEGNLLY